MENSDLEQLQKYSKLYLEIIMRYKDYIEENEQLYVAELPKLVTPDNDSVVATVNKIKSGFPMYSFEENFKDAIRASYEYVNSEISTIEVPIQFWLTPEETIRIGAGDLFDKAVLLCSMLIALGNPSTKIIVMIDDSERRFVVYSELQNGLVAIDLSSGISEYASKEELVEKLGIGKEEEMTAYEFNDKMYSSLA